MYTTSRTGYMLNPNTQGGNVYREELLGFDARVTPSNARALWSRTRRRKHITGRYVTVPLSIDPFVWHSVFDHGIGLEMSSADRAAAGYSGISRPKWIGPNDLWEHPNALFNTVNEKLLEGRDYWVAAFTVLSNEETLFLYSIGTELPLGVSWRLLGWDVASYDKVSALANYQFEPIELRQIKETWGKNLNRFNLFTDADFALRYVEEMNILMRADAPFYRFGIYFADTDVSYR